MGRAVVISEKQFAASHGAFWHQLLPMSEEYVRTRNRSLGRFAPPLGSGIPAKTRGLINEVGFRLFAASLEFDRKISSVPARVKAHCIEEALHYVRRIRERGREPAAAPTRQGLREALALAERLAVFFNRAAPKHVRPFPVFPGCGWIDACAGDVLADGSLFEVKAGGRRFRAIDLRQTLVYSALDFAGKSFGVAEICLVNPRLGVFLHEPLEAICQDLSGRAATEVLGEIVEYVSDPVDRYATG